jgi:hypothetical protein
MIFRKLVRRSSNFAGEITVRSRTPLDAPIELRHASLGLYFVYLRMACKHPSAHDRSDLGLKVSETFNKQHRSRGARMTVRVNVTVVPDKRILFISRQTLRNIMRTTLFCFY